MSEPTLPGRTDGQRHTFTGYHLIPVGLGLFMVASVVLQLLVGAIYAIGG